MTDRLTNEAVVEEALAWLGTPYRHQASLRGVGCDCLGLVRGIWRALYGCEPETAPPYSQDLDEAKDAGQLARVVGRYFTAADTLSEGSLLLLRWHPAMPAKHLGIVETVGDRRGGPTFVHAHSSVGVCRARLEGTWTCRLVRIFHFPQITSAPETD
ncbi:MAG: peptidase P60 [Pseudomonadota bacterium]